MTLSILKKTMLPATAVLSSEAAAAAGAAAWFWLQDNANAIRATTPAMILIFFI
jgi:hypothetical protein